MRSYTVCNVPETHTGSLSSVPFFYVQVKCNSFVMPTCLEKILSDIHTSDLLNKFTIQTNPTLSV